MNTPVHTISIGQGTAHGPASATRPDAGPRLRAFTLLEILLTMAILALLASMALPMLSDENRARLMAASAVLSSDIEAAQMMSIATPDNPIAVRFDVANKTWWLASGKSPETPIIRDDTHQAYTVTIGQGRASAAAGVTFATSQITNDVLAFDSHGGVTPFNATPAIVLTSGSITLTLSLNPNTGSITETLGAVAASDAAIIAAPSKTLSK